MRGLHAVLALLVFVLAPSASDGQVPPPPHQSPPGVIRVWGNAQTEGLVRQWVAGFATLHPGLRIETRLTGSDIGMAGLYTGQADIALLGREATESEVKAFEWVFRHKPTPVEILTGSIDRAGRSPALVVFVHRDNPIERLDLAQLEAIFGQEHRHAPNNIRTWGQLGLEGEWADQPIRLYAPMAESGTGRFFRANVLGGSNKMNWDHLTEFDDPVRPGGASDESGWRILDALAQDRYGLAVSNLQFVPPAVKPVALRILTGGDYRSATRTTLIDRQYPLTRSVYAYINRPDGGPIDPQVGLFLEYVLSAAGQAAVAEDGGYLPLNPALLTAQRKKLAFSTAAGASSSLFTVSALSGTYVRSTPPARP